MLKMANSFTWKAPIEEGNFKLCDCPSGSSPETTVTASLSKSANHSEPECEIHPKEEMIDEPLVGFGLGDDEQLSVDERLLDLTMTNPPKDDEAFREHCKTIALWKNHAANILPPTKERNETKKNVPGKVVPSDKGQSYHEDSQSVSSSIQRLQEAMDDCSTIDSDYSSSDGLQSRGSDGFSLSALDIEHELQDDDSSFCIGLEGTDSEIQIAVNEIRKEAEKMDTIMILDQLKTLQVDFESVTKKYSVASLENEELKIQLQESEDRVAHMELERDLHQADTIKLKEDMKTLVSNMFDISTYEGSELPSTKFGNDEEVGLSTQSTKDSQSNRLLSLEKVPFPRKRSLDMVPASERMRIIGLVENNGNKLPRNTEQIDLSMVGMDRNRIRSYERPKVDTICLLPSHGRKPYLRNQNIFRNKCERTSNSLDDLGCTRMERCQYMPTQRRGKEKRNSLLCQHRSISPMETGSTSFTHDTRPTEEQAEEKENRRCGMLFRRRSKRNSLTNEDVSMMKYQIGQLNKLMKTSLMASEKLRKRITTITQYYEGVIYKLQTKLSEARNEKSRVQVHLMKRISEAELLISEHEQELRQKDQEILRLMEELDRGEV